MLLRALILFCLLLPSSLSPAEESVVLFREDFATLDNWKPFFFPKIKTHSTYTIERDGDRHVLRAESNASASAIVYRESFDVYHDPVVRWRWKVRNVYRKGDATVKDGDDFPMRVYVMFLYDPDQAGFGDRILYGIAKSLYGEYPPHSSLNYVWSSKEHPERIITNPFTDRAKDVLLRKGAALAGTWQEERVNILEDYQAAFGAKPPVQARIAIMNDSDNTGESSVSWMEYIEVLP
jgi:hypothetical protein